MNDIMKLIETEIGVSLTIQAQILKSLVLILIATIAYSLIKKLLYKPIANSRVYYKTKKTLGYVFVLVTFILIGRVWFQGVQSLTTFLGLFTAGLAITMRDLIMNVADWGYIVWKGLFNVGHGIEIDGIKGDVIDVGLFEFALMETNNWIEADQSTGRIVYLPNSFIFRKPTFNYSTGIPFIWNEVPIHITY